MVPKPIKHYTYFAQNAQGAIQQLPIQAFAPETPPPEMIEGLYQQLVAKHGLGVPRPTHFSATVLHELPPTEEGAGKKPSLLIVPQGGNGVRQEGSQPGGMR